MHELYADAYIHIKRGDRLWGEASDSKSPEKYKEAIDEYQQATDLSPANTEAMNDYANAFWDWRLRFAQDPSLDSIAQQAKDFAQRANAMTTTAGTTTHLINAATLIEVLLGTARADKALEVLEKKEEELPDHAFFNDVRWDLAQAYLCAAADARQAQVSFHQRYNPQAKAQALFQKILELEATRESQPFTDLFKKIHEREKTRETQPFTDTSPNALNDKVCFLRQPIASEASPNRMLLHSNHNEKNPRKARSLGQVAEGLKESR
jgi:tetratricopeptide (TPR) repeat protein